MSRPSVNPTHHLSRRRFLASALAGAAAGVASTALAASAPAKRPAFIDVHTHLGRYRDYNQNLTAKGLVEWMDANNVERSVVLPLVSPESTTFLQPPEKVLAECKEFPKRLIPFCSLDPRAHYGNSANLQAILKRYKDQGAKGFGEHKVGLPFDHLVMILSNDPADFGQYQRA